MQGSCSVLLLALAAALASAQNTCQDCFSFPNRCPVGSTVSDVTAYLPVNGTCDAVGTAPQATCCTPSNFNCTIVANTRCSTSYQSQCTLGTLGVLTWPGNTSRCNSGCPPNYRQELTWTLFCVANNCQAVSGSDVTQCVACLPGFYFIADGSCQPYPIINVTIASGTVSNTSSQTFGSGTYNLTLGTDFRLNTRTTNLSISIAPQGSQSYFTTDPSLPAPGAPASLYFSDTRCVIAGATTVWSSLPIVTWVNYTFPLGSTIINCTTRDTNNFTTSIVVRVTVRDLELPRTTCNSSFSMFTLPSLNYNTFVWPRSLINGTQAVDNVNVVSTTCVNGPGSNNFAISGTNPQSVTTITCRANDAAGNQGSCTYSVTVIDAEAPRVTCPANRVFNTTFRSSFANNTNITFVIGRNSVDNVNVAAFNCSRTLNNATQYPIGTSLLQCSARDGAFNFSHCSFTVTVFDVEPPVLSCPSTPVVLQPTSWFATLAPPVTVTDNSGQPVRLSCSSNNFPNATNFTLGTTRVDCTAWDVFNNSASCSLNITVLDPTPPLITCPLPINDVMVNGLNYSETTYAATSSDNVNVTSMTCTPTSGSQFPLGPTIVQCRAMDASNNTATCLTSVNVVDNQPPLVTCPNLLPVVSNSSSNTSVPFLSPSASDNYFLASTSLTVTGPAPSFSGNLTVNTSSYTFLAYGTAFFKFSALDASGNPNLCSWSVTVLPPEQIIDTTPPTIINCPTNVTNSTPFSSFNSYPNSTLTIRVNTLPDKSFASVTLPALNATDSFGSVTTSYLYANPETTFFRGNYVVAYQAVDGSGNKAFCTFLVSVSDVQPPFFTNCPNNMTSRTGPGVATAPALSWPPTGITATDNVQIVDPFGICTSSLPGACPAGGSPSLAQFPVGVTTFRYTAVDTSGNQAAPCFFTVTVIDDDPPQLSGCPTLPLELTTSPGQALANISSQCPNFVYSDNVGVVSALYTSIPAGYNCSTPIPIINALIIQFQVKDTSGLVTTCQFTVSVVDRESPQLTGCNSTFVATINATTNPGSSFATVSWPAVQASDNSGSATLTFMSLPSGGLNSGSNFPLGLTTILYTARDQSLNPAVCSLLVSVTDKELPVISNCPTALGAPSPYVFVIPTDPGTDSVVFTMPAITSSDNVGIQGSSYFPIMLASSQNYTFTVGTTPIIYSAQDTSFNTAHCSFTVRVVDQEAPVFHGCPTGFNVFTDPNKPSAVVSWPTVTVTDNVDSRVTFSLISSPPGFTLGSAFNVGNTVVSMTSIDSAGNIGTCVFSVTVVDNQRPNIICPSNALFNTYSDSVSLGLATWRAPFVSDNVVVGNLWAFVSPSNETLGSSDIQMNFTAGLYSIKYTAVDLAGNTANCGFNVTVFQTQPANSNANQNSGSSTGASTAILGGAGGGAGLLILLLVLFVVFMRRDHKKRLMRASASYAELMAMSDELILERARVIQQALMEQRLARPPPLLETEFVHPERKFAPPPSSLLGLQEYMRGTVGKEIPRHCLELGGQLGAGEFGAVFEGYCVREQKDAETGDNKLKVAVKMLKQEATDDSKVSFLKEAAIMAQFSHPNIVELVGVCTIPDEEPILIVLEYMHLGSLHSYLQNPMVKDKIETLTMVRMALDVVAGMRYLAEAGFVHRDLAARNVLLDKTMTCRIADFGLSFDAAAKESQAAETGEGGEKKKDKGAAAAADGDNDIYGVADVPPARPNNAPSMGETAEERARLRMPIRWTAIEAIMFHQFSTASDVWSFGVLLWEIWSYCTLPYSGMGNSKVIEELNKGYRLPKPESCPYDVYRLMIECWDTSAKRRIKFPKVHSTLIQIYRDIDQATLNNDGAAGTLYETSGFAPDEDPNDGGQYGSGSGMDDDDTDYAKAANAGRRVTAFSEHMEADYNFAGSMTGKGDDLALYDLGKDLSGAGAGHDNRNSALTVTSLLSRSNRDSVFVPTDLAGNPLYALGHDIDLEKGTGAAADSSSGTGGALDGQATTGRRRSSVRAGAVSDDGYIHMGVTG